MKTVNYMLRDKPDRASGDAGSRVRGRGLPKVVDLAAGRAENLAELDEPTADSLPMDTPRQYRDRKSVRCGRWTALDWAELAATLAVTVAFLALIARVLLF